MLFVLIFPSNYFKPVFTLPVAYGWKLVDKKTQLKWNYSINYDDHLGIRPCKQLCLSGPPPVCALSLIHI